MESETRLVVRYAETDQMGIAHHSNYPVWFEAGRTDFLKKAGMSNTDIEESGILLPLYYMECNFMNPAKYEDEITVKTRIQKINCARIGFCYEIIDRDQKTIALGNTAHAWTDKLLKPQNVQKKLPELYRSLMAAMRND